MIPCCSPKLNVEAAGTNANTHDQTPSEVRTTPEQNSFVQVVEIMAHPSYSSAVVSDRNLPQRRNKQTAAIAFMPSIHLTMCVVAQRRYTVERRQSVANDHACAGPSVVSSISPVSPSSWENRTTLAVRWVLENRGRYHPLLVSAVCVALEGIEVSNVRGERQRACGHITENECVLP